MNPRIPNFEKNEIAAFLFLTVFILIIVSEAWETTSFAGISGSSWAGFSGERNMPTK